MAEIKESNQVTELKESSSLVLLRSVHAISEKNLPIIQDKTARMKAALSALKAINDDKVDAWAEQALVKAREVETTVDKLRKEISKPLDSYKGLIMTFEKGMQDEMKRIKLLRDQYANQKLAKQKEEQAKIEKEKIYAVHEGEVKAEMKAAIEYGVAQKLQDLENAIADMFSKMTLENFQAIAGKLNFKPALKAELIDQWLRGVPRNKQIMSDEKFEELVTRAKAYPAWSYDNINGGYLEQAIKIIAKYRDKIQPRVKELQAIANAGANSDKMKAEADERQRKEEEKRKADAQAKLNTIANVAEAEKQNASLTAEFNAQVAKQGIQELSGVRGKSSYRIDPKVENNLGQVASIIGKMVLHMLSEKDYKGIFERDKAGFIKKDDKGEPIYVDGVAYWLKEIAKLDYAVNIDGLIRTDEVTTVAKAK